jgi:transcriptional regulator GlxA family with amidase domain
MSAHAIGIVVFPDAEELDFVGPWEVFTASAHLRERAGAAPDTVVLLAGSLDPVRCAKGLRVLPDATWDAHTALDVVVVPGGQGFQQAMHDPGLTSWLAATSRTARWTTSVCTGAFVLHGAGLSAGRRMSTHWAFEDALAELGVDVARDVRYVHDRGVVTSQGISAGIDMALWLVGQLHGPAHARATQRFIQYEPAPPYTADV